MSDRATVGQEATEALLHYGVKGMKWGVRRSLERHTSPTVSVTTKKRLGQQTIKTRGGVGRKPSEDATRAAISKQIARKSGKQALSNDELRLLVERLDLEKRADRHAASGLGAQFVKALFEKEK